MKALFWVDNQPVKNMFASIIDALPDEWVISHMDYRNKQLTKGCVEDIIACEKPQIMILAREEATVVEQWVTQISRDKNIPTLLVPHGMLMPNEVELWGVDGRFFRLRHFARLIKQGYRKYRKGNISLPQLAKIGLFRVRNDFRDKKTLSRYDNFTKVAAFGEVMKGILIRYGVSPENIVITGNPKFDLTYKLRRNGKGGNIVLITNYLVEFGTWNSKQREKYVEAVSDVSHAVSMHLMVKIHPVNESKNEYKDIVSDQICQSTPLGEVLADCAIGITTMSAGGLEVMAAGKPLVIYNPYNDITQYTETSGAYTARNKEELLSVVKDIIENGMSEERKKLDDEFVYQQAYLQDGKASERIAKLIKEMANGN